MSSPAVSVIIPAHNRAGTLPRAVRSVLGQTIKDLELIVVDDASTDDTMAVVGGFEDGRITYIRRSQRGGASVARNTGIEQARGEYVAFLDSDDEWLPQKLEKQLKKFRELPKGYGVVYSRYALFDDDTKEKVLVGGRDASGNAFPLTLKYCISQTGTFLVRKECLDAAGVFDESLPCSQDWDLFIRLSRICKFGFVGDALTRVYIHGRQITVDLDGRIRDWEAMMEKYDAELMEHPRIKSLYHMRLGKAYLMTDDVGKARECFKAALKANSLRLSNLVHVIMSSLAPGIHKALLARFFGMERHYMPRR